MKSLKYIKILMSFCVLSAFSSFFACDFQCGEEYDFLSGNAFRFYIIEKGTGNKILNSYNYDTVAIYNDDWTFATPFPYSDENRWCGRDGMASFYFIKDQDKGVINKLISRKFFMYYNYQAIDTIAINFEMKPECNDHIQIMKYFKVAYNDSVYFDGPAEHVPFINFLK